MIQQLEQNYISVVVVSNNDENIIERKISEILNVLKEHFLYYELIIVDNMSTDRTYAFLEKSSEKFTYIQLPIHHNNQDAMTAGVNIAVGDYIVEIENLKIDINYEKIFDMYKKCQEGNDFVFLVPSKISLFSKIFYSILNKNLKGYYISNITSSLITLSSRRGQYKTSEVGNKLVNRNVSYALTGLQISSLNYEINYLNNRSFKDNYLLMMQTLIYYTDFIIKLAEKTSLFLFCFSFISIIYSIYSKYTFDTAPGWASMVILMSIGFSGIFFMLGIVLRYLDNILKNTSNSKNYIYRSIVKK